MTRAVKDGTQHSEGTPQGGGVSQRPSEVGGGARTCLVLSAEGFRASRNAAQLGSDVMERGAQGDAGEREQTEASPAQPIKRFAG